VPPLLPGWLPPLVWLLAPVAVPRLGAAPLPDPPAGADPPGWLVPPLGWLVLVAEPPPAGEVPPTGVLLTLDRPAPLPPVGLAAPTVLPLGAVEPPTLLPWRFGSAETL
jgi:hypothetical protein